MTPTSNKAVPNPYVLKGREANAKYSGTYNNGATMYGLLNFSEFK